MVLAAFLSTWSHLACQLLLLPNLYPGWGCSNQGIEPSPRNRSKFKGKLIDHLALTLLQ